jgi:energy-coupling factor transporter transmembrane protein EcfT
LPELHPSSRIVLWCGWAVGVELARPLLLPALAVVCATAFVFVRYRRAVWRLLRRSRWLMLVLLLSYAYTLPGHALWPGWASPTAEGVRFGVERIVRLALMLVALAVLLADTPPPRLVYGLYSLARPLAMFGLDRRAFAARLGLTLEYVEHSRSGARAWLQRLRDPLPDSVGPSSYRLLPEHWQWFDSAAILAMLMVDLGLVWLG